MISVLLDRTLPQSPGAVMHCEEARAFCGGLGRELLFNSPEDSSLWVILAQAPDVSVEASRCSKPQAIQDFSADAQIRISIIHLPQNT